ncbi:MAG: 5-(carboxyamino)imidazole ribonucleotide mutase [candidate division Zixibacteria bacterium]|nr:5-(carboxyamino)imidazole ribonucleotide mutase [candidate division Zixibacteria bacterium]
MSTPKVLIIVGSKSDLEVIGKAVEVLQRLQIEVSLEVSSAHRQPERTRELAQTARQKGYGVVICGAGLSAALPGVVASYTSLPVLGVPLAVSELGGLDALLAISQMPRGIPVGCLALGGHGAVNAALLAARIIAVTDKGVQQRLEEYRKQAEQS